MSGLDANLFYVCLGLMNYSNLVRYVFFLVGNFIRRHFRFQSGLIQFPDFGRFALNVDTRRGNGKYSNCV